MGGDLSVTSIVQAIGAFETWNFAEVLTLTLRNKVLLYCLRLETRLLNSKTIVLSKISAAFKQSSCIFT